MPIEHPRPPDDTDDKIEHAQKGEVEMVRLRLRLRELWQTMGKPQTMQRKAHSHATRHISWQQTHKGQSR